jgi:hypothetical protein
VRALLRIVAVILAALAAFLVYAVIHAASSVGGARVGVSIAYVVGALVLLALAGRLWRGPAARA